MDNLLNTKDKGDISEAMVLAALLKTKSSVAIPFGDNQRYDLLFEEDGKFHRVQCKTASLSSNASAIRFPASSSYAHRGGKRKTYQGQIEYFGVYSPDTREVYLIPISDVESGTNATLRLKDSRNGQRKGVRWARDYVIG